MMRAALPTDLDQIFELGFDVWGEGSSLESYREGCRASPKYARGFWYVFENRDRRLVSAMIAYSLPQINSRAVIGIGSIATHPNFRNRGYASRMVCEVLNVLHENDQRSLIFLHSDIGPKFYEDLGFIELPSRFQNKVGSTTMLCGSSEFCEEIVTDPGFKVPAYF